MSVAQLVVDFFWCELNNGTSVLIYKLLVSNVRQNAAGQEHKCLNWMLCDGQFPDFPDKLEVSSSNQED